MGPLAAAIMAAPGILQLLFGGKSQPVTQRTVTTTPPTGRPAHPAYPMLSTLIMEMMMKRYGNMAGAGWPGGKGINVGGRMEDIFRMIEENWADLFKQDWGGKEKLGEQQPGDKLSRDMLRR